LIRNLALLLAMLSTQAQALSCQRPDVARSFHAISDAEVTYHALRGQLNFDPSLMPNSYVQDGASPAPVPAQFQGFGLTLAGFDQPISAAITLKPDCSGPWCGSMRPSQDVLIFVQKTASGYSLEITPCSGMIFEAPSDVMVETLVSCLNGKACKIAN